MKRLLRFLKWTGITLGVLFAIYLGINAFDETLDLGAAAIINAQAKIKLEENAYFIVVGLRAPFDRAPGEYGQECVERLIKISQNYKEMIALFSSGKTGCSDHKDALVWEGLSAISCERQQESCLLHYQKQSAEIMRLAEKNKILLRRYERLLVTEYFDDVSYTNYLTAPHPYDLRSELYSAVSAIKLQEGDVGEFIQRTSAEAKFHRMVLRGNSGYISKLIALSSLVRAASLASDAVQNQPTLARQHLDSLLTISQPLTVAERSLDSTMVSELRYLTAIMAFGDAKEDYSVFNKLKAHFTY